MEFVEHADDEAGADLDRALSGIARRGSGIDDRSGGRVIRRHAETMACIVVEMYQERCRLPE